MHRRLFLASAAIAAGVRIRARAAAGERRTTSASGFVQTVRGRVPASDLGRVLPHEHVLVDFVGADRVSPARYDRDAVFAAALPHLRRAHELGARTVFECTPNFLGRDVRLLTRLSEATKLHLVTNTGLYGARNNIFLPPYAHVETPAQLAHRWIAEAIDGIDDTEIRPGFIKCGVDAGPSLSAIHRKLVSAAALTHASTGLTIAVHTGRGPGLQQLDVLRKHRVSPDAFVWVHAQGATDDALLAAADRGAWLSLDGLRPNSVTRHLHICRELKQRGHLARILLSHDAGWFDPAKPGGGPFRSYELLFTTFLPLLQQNGFTAAEIDRMTVQNPAQAFAVRVRSVS